MKFAIFIGILLFAVVLYLIFKPKEVIQQPIEEPVLKDTLTFNASPSIDYSTSNNIEKSFTMGTFNNNLMLTALSLTFDINNSIFNSSSIKISIQDVNNNEVYNTVITNFTTMPIVISINNIIINKDYKVILKLNGINTKVYNPSISFNYYIIPLNY